MGGTNWSAAAYTERTHTRAATGAPVFKHDADVWSGRTERKCHESLDPKNFKNGIREARDSDLHPTTKPVVVALDVTGSMQNVPRQVQAELPKLMSLLLSKSYLPHPAVCVAAVGDAKYDKVPLQISQFEAGIEIDDHITNLFMEGGGGGNAVESYELMLYFLARCTACDSWIRRGEKGYAFIVCDEGLADCVSATEVQKVFGHDLQENIDISRIVEEVKSKWEVFCLVPQHTSHANDDSMRENWRKHFSERIVSVESPAELIPTIASLVGTMEDVGDTVLDLTDVGYDVGTVNNVARSVSTFRDTRTLTKMTGPGTGMTSI